ncbi:MAG: energy transducer TonB [Candidatus Latescibacterota bacterium]|nr:energy transducer TonB [Candidatus Latescibacterota bacterium]
MLPIARTRGTDLLNRPWDLPRKKAPEADPRQTYAKTFWSCFGISAVFHIFVVVLFPDFEADAYAKSEDAVIIQIEDVPETRQERRPPPPPRPVVPIVSNSEDIPDDATIMETDLDFGLDDLAPPPPLEELREIELEEEEEEIVEIWRVEKQPVPTKSPRPAYPEIARKAGITGNVSVEVLVDKQGKVEAIGQIIGNEVFHEAARQAAMKWEFTPAIQNDRPVKVWVMLPFKFTLN